jgi:hypothetical protein
VGVRVAHGGLTDSGDGLSHDGGLGGSGVAHGGLIGPLPGDGLHG